MRFSSKLLAFALLAGSLTVGCAPKLIMVDDTIVGDHFVREMLRPVATDEDTTLSHYYAEVCDIKKGAKATQCNTSLILENVTNVSR